MKMSPYDAFSFLDSERISECFMDVLGDARDGSGETEDNIDLGIDLLPQLTGIGIPLQLTQGRFLLLGKYARLTEPRKGWAGCVKATADARVPFHFLDLLVHEPAHRLEEVEVEPDQLVELVDGVHLGHRVQSIVAQVAAHQIPIALLYKAVVVLLIGATA